MFAFLLAPEFLALTTGLGFGAWLRSEVDDTPQHPVGVSGVDTVKIALFVSLGLGIAIVGTKLLKGK